MDKIMAIAKKYNLFVIEDAAQSIDSFYKGKPLGSIGHLSTFSFHETKNIMCGEGGMLVINDERFVNRAEIIREKGTNRSSFFRGEIDKYGWVDVGSSFLPSDILAAFLYSQLENLEDIQKRRLFIWKTYYKNLKELENRGVIRIPEIPIYASNNAHMFYIICKNSEERTSLIDTLKKNNISAVFHYLSLHKSPFYKNNHDGRILKNSDHYSDCLVRLPLFYNIKNNDIEFVCSVIKSFFNNE
jgi:dTDP-4-amino-4,6-dideoxygalactose transaminase